MSTQDRYVDAVNRQDWMAIADLLHDDYVGEFPQSGERIVGPEAYRAIYSRYDADIPEVSDMACVAGTKPEVDVVRPLGSALPIITVEGGGDEFTVVGHASYSNGSSGYVIGFIELEAGKIIRERLYFAEDFDPPEWRADLVELTDAAS